MNPRDVIATLLTLTICSFIILTEFRWYAAPIGGIPDKSMELINDFLTFMLGGVFGYLGNRDN